MTDREGLLDELRPVAFAIAYRMLGSVSEAEDVVQEALLRLHQTLQDGDQVASPRAFVATVTTRLAINELHSARVRRERYVGDWLPEPIITDGHDDPAWHAEMADSLSQALLVLLESLSPEQRAVLLLHDVFDYGYPEIAAIVGKSEDNVRQLATRARRHVQQRRPRFQTTREQRDELARRFFAAVQQGDLAGLEALLAHDVVLTADGGGKVPALPQPLYGSDLVALFLTDGIRLIRHPGVSLRPVEVNGGPGALWLDPEQRLISVWSLDFAGGQITGIRSIVNPDKLAHLGPVGDFTSLLMSADKENLIMATQHAVDEADIRQHMEELVEALRAMDLDRVKSIYAPDIVSFDAGPPLQAVGVEAKSKNWVDAFTMFQRPLGFEVRDLTITVDGDMAFAHSFNRLSGTLKNGSAMGGFWVRATYCFRKIDGTWLVVHDHVSVPLDMATGRGVLDLEPTAEDR